MNVLDVSTESLARRIAAGLRKISVAIRSRAWKEAGVRRITPLQAQTLAVLHARPGYAATVSAIAEELAVSLPTVSDMVRTLEKKALVKKRRSESDARVVTVKLTAKGKRSAEKSGGRQDFLVGVSEQFSGSEQETWLQLLIKMINALHLRGDAPTARMCVTCRFFQPNVHKDAKRPHHCAFFDASFGNRLLRIECEEHEPATKANAKRNWKTFLMNQTDK